MAKTLTKAAMAAMLAPKHGITKKQAAEIMDRIVEFL
jgi:nucleoid DNA-binding protein